MPGIIGQTAATDYFHITNGCQQMRFTKKQKQIFLEIFTSSIAGNSSSAFIAYGFLQILANDASACGTAMK
jgi:hypothetical protein